MRQVLGAGALGRPRGMGWRERWERESGWGTHVNPWLIHVNVWQKPLQYCKVISLQLINRKKLKWWKGKISNEQYSNWQSFHSDLKEKSKFYRQAKAKRIQHHQTNFIENVKGISLSGKQKTTIRNVHREQAHGHGEMGEEGEMYGKSNMDAYIIICKIDSQWEFAVWLRKLKQGLWINIEGWDWEGVWKRRGYMYTYGWFILRFDRKQQNFVKQLYFNKNN